MPSCRQAATRLAKRFLVASYLDLYLNNLEPFSELIGELGYAGLQSACLMLQENRRGPAWPRRGLGGPDAQLARHLAGAGPVATLEAPSSAGASEALINHLRLPVWDAPLEDDDAEVLRALLVEERQQTETGEDLLAVEEHLGPAEVQASEPTGAADATPDEQGEEIAQPGAVATGQSDEPLDEDLPPQVSELVAVLLEEIPVMEEPLERLLQTGGGEDGASAAREEACEVYADYLERFADAAEAVGFSGLQQVVALDARKPGSPGGAAARLQRLGRWTCWRPGAATRASISAPRTAPLPARA